MLGHYVIHPFFGPYVISDGLTNGLSINQLTVAYACKNIAERSNAKEILVTFRE